MSDSVPRHSTPLSQAGDPIDMAVDPMNPDSDAAPDDERRIDDEAARSVDGEDPASGLLAVGPLAVEIVPETYRILIADDLEDTRFVIRRALGRMGFQVEEATDGEMLIEKARSSRPDLMIVDIMMPKLDGLTALSQIRQDPALAHAYIILLTGKATVDEKIAGFQQGADDYVTKPYSLAELKARVHAGIRLRAMHRSLTESQQILVRQEKLATIGVMAAGMAHEFNNIMGAISGYAQLAQANEKFVARLIEVALDQAERSRKITASLATFAATARTEAKPTPPESLIESAMWLLSKEFKSRDLELDVVLEPDLPQIEVHVGKLQEVLVHLLLNAIQAVSSRGDEAKVQLRASSNGSRVVIEIDDNGPGIPDDLRLRVFDPFFTTKGALGKSSEPGTGLGLTFSLNIVQSHGGQLDVVPSQLGGACLRVDLPAMVAAPARPRATTGVPARRPSVATTAAEPEPETVAEVSAEPPANVDSGQAPAILASTDARPPLGPVLVLEDDPGLQELITEVMGPLDCVCYADGSEGLDFCRTESPRMVVLDVTLAGGMTGWEVLDQLRALDPSPPVILTTGSIEPLPTGLDAYPRLKVLPKPYTLGDLEDAVAALEPVDQ